MCARKETRVGKRSRNRRIMAYSNGQHDAQVAALMAEAEQCHQSWLLRTDKKLTNTLRSCTGQHLPEVMHEHLDSLCQYRSPLSLTEVAGAHFLADGRDFLGEVKPDVVEAECNSGGAGGFKKTGKKARRRCRSAADEDWEADAAVVLPQTSATVASTVPHPIKIAQTPTIPAPMYPIAEGDGLECPRCYESGPYVTRDVLRGGLISGKKGFTAVRYCPTCGFALCYEWRNF